MRKRNKIKKAEHCSAFMQIHSSAKGDTTIQHKNWMSYSCSITKNLSVFLICCPRNSHFSRTNRRNNIYPGANSPYFLCELPVRTMIIFAIHNHLLRSYHITSSDFMYLLYQNGDNQIFLHVKIRHSKLRLIFFVDFLFIILPRLQCNFRLK